MCFLRTFPEQKPKLKFTPLSERANIAQNLKIDQCMKKLKMFSAGVSHLYYVRKRSLSPNCLFIRYRYKMKLYGYFCTSQFGFKTHLF